VSQNIIGTICYFVYLLGVLNFKKAAWLKRNEKQQKQILKGKTLPKNVWNNFFK